MKYDPPVGIEGSETDKCCNAELEAKLANAVLEMGRSMDRDPRRMKQKNPLECCACLVLKGHYLNQHPTRGQHKQAAAVGCIQPTHYTADHGTQAQANTSD